MSVLTAAPAPPNASSFEAGSAMCSRPDTPLTATIFSFDSRGHPAAWAAGLSWNTAPALSRGRSIRSNREKNDYPDGAVMVVAGIVRLVHFRLVSVQRTAGEFTEFSISRKSCSWLDRHNPVSRLQGCRSGWQGRQPRTLYFACV